MIFDMRAPDFGAPIDELHAAALDHAAWADELGFDVIGFGFGYRLFEREVFPHLPRGVVPHWNVA